MCQRCGNDYEEVWYTSDDLWEKVTGIPGGDHGGNFCIKCFNEMAVEKGVFLYWECAEDSYPTLFKS